MNGRRFDPTEISYEDDYGNDVIRKDNCEGDETDGENNDETEEGEFVPETPITTPQDEPQDEPEPVPMQVMVEKGIGDSGEHVYESEKEKMASDPVNTTLPLPEEGSEIPTDAEEVGMPRNNLGREENSQKETMHCMGCTRNEDTSPPRKLAAIMTDKLIPTPLILTASTSFNCGSKKAVGPDPSTPLGFGDLNGLPQGCFGPFPSTPKFRSGSSQACDPDFSKPLGKRKRCITGGLNLSPNFIPSMPNLSNLDSPLPTVEGTIDPAEGTNPNNIDHGATTNRPLSEADKTVEIGKRVGFDIEADNPILLEVLGEAGENNGPQ
ncbi:hypothetical protein L2E82_40091 [Cichorium intybus]|uniref:Uncharacterized protein n=1 Tax=Cichorium intybus TaxID=13427 RepID=A0ACB9ALS3_CICIN|nr:hypothetical protein L2E82_40091 [Cichorium intybus]